MKLPPQIDAVVRQGRSWPAGRSSVHGVSASFRTDFDVCEPGATSDKWKCKNDSGYAVCKCPNGTCNCCQNGCHLAINSCDHVTGECACN
jgi:hypothetical protein